MSLKLTGIAKSICTARPLLVLAEKGVTDFELYSPDFSTGEHKSEQHRSKQPFGQIPVLEDNGFILYESRSIARYLAKKYADQGPPLLPPSGDDKALALFEQWASIEQNNFDAFASPIYIQKAVNPMMGLPVDKDMVDYFEKRLAEKLDVFNLILSKQTYMGGNTFSLIDIFYMPLTAALFRIGEGHLISGRPFVQSWWDRVTARESWKKIYQ